MPFKHIKWFLLIFLFLGQGPLVHAQQDAPTFVYAKSTYFVQPKNKKPKQGNRRIKKKKVLNSPFEFKQVNTAAKPLYVWIPKIDGTTKKFAVPYKEKPVNSIQISETLHEQYSYLYYRYRPQKMKLVFKFTRYNLPQSFLGTSWDFSDNLFPPVIDRIQDFVQEGVLDQSKYIRLGFIYKWGVE